jgi:hypothetical protein
MISSKKVIGWSSRSSPSKVNMRRQRQKWSQAVVAVGVMRWWRSSSSKGLVRRPPAVAGVRRRRRRSSSASSPHHVAITASVSSHVPGPATPHVVVWRSHWHIIHHRRTSHHAMIAWRRRQVLRHPTNPSSVHHHHGTSRGRTWRRMPHYPPAVIKRRAPRVTPATAKRGRTASAKVAPARIVVGGATHPGSRARRTSFYRVTL